MTEFNSCAKLVTDESYKEAFQYYNDILFDGKDPFRTMLNMQLSLQEKLHSQYPDRCKHPSKLESLKDIYEWIRDNKIAFDDEHSELISALPGMNLPAKERSAIWKKWKSNHETIGEKKLSDLTKDELIELKMEFVDQFHFLMNIMIALDINSEELFCYYYLKNAENFRRYNEGY